MHLGPLRYPFISAAAALLMLSAMLGRFIAPGYYIGTQITVGLLFGALACVVLYALMRALAQR